VRNHMANEEQAEDTPEVLPAKGKDPWAHRSDGMKCGTCMFAVPKSGSINVGRCRRHAPTMNGYPVIFITDWCGDHKLDETKI